MDAMKIELLGLENIKKAFAIANNAIYFDDNSDYLTALYQICKCLNPDITEDDVGKKYVDEEWNKNTKSMFYLEWNIIKSEVNNG